MRLHSPTAKRRPLVPDLSGAFSDPLDAPEAAGLDGPTRFGALIIGAFALGFFIWAAFAPLHAGAVAPAEVAPHGKVRVLQHREGGIIRAIAVREGDRVTAGAPLLELADVAADAAFEAARRKRASLIATIARLEAEIAGETPVMPEELDVADPAIARIVEDEFVLFERRMRERSARHDLLRQRAAMLGRLADGYQAQEASARTQLELIREEILSKQTLLDKGLIARPELLRLRRLEADLAGRSGDYSAQIAYTLLQRQEAFLELAAFDAEHQERTAGRLAEVRYQLAGVEQEMRAASDVVSRRSVVAPVDGIVANLRYSTIGGVVGPGQPIMDIVPVHEALIVNARVAPMDIDVVHPGQRVRVRLVAFSQREARPVEGRVLTVSSDRMADPDTPGAGYYLAEIAIDETAAARFGGAGLVAGMPAEVLIVAKSRTALQYLLEPFTRTLDRGLREV